MAGAAPRRYAEDDEHVVSRAALLQAEQAGFDDGGHEPPREDWPSHPRLADAYRRGWLRAGRPYPSWILCPEARPGWEPPAADERNAE